MAFEAFRFVRLAPVMSLDSVISGPHGRSLTATVALESPRYGLAQWLSERPPSCYVLKTHVMHNFIFMLTICSNIIGRQVVSFVDEPKVLLASNSQLAAWHYVHGQLDRESILLWIR